MNEDEEFQIYLKMIKENLKSNGGFFVDVGASDGVSISNTNHLANDKNWKGISIELDSNKFEILKKTQPREEVVKVNISVTPFNIIEILKNNNTPNVINFLTIDIDGYDYYVLEEILKNYLCETVMVEINEKIPYPIQFTVDYIPGYFWQGDHFYGMSLSKLNVLCKNMGYTIVDYKKCNAIMLRTDLLPIGFKSKSVEELYNSGYKNFTDIQPTYNDNVKHWMYQSPEDAIISINEFFKNKSKYTISLGESK